MFGLTKVRACIFIGMVLAIVVLAAADAVLWSRLDAKDAEITSLSQQLEVASKDAVRWQIAAGQGQAIIDRQALELRRLQSDGAAARTISDQNQVKAQQRIEKLEAQVSAMKEKAREHPDQVRDLGPIVRDALPSLRH